MKKHSKLLSIINYLLLIAGAVAILNIFIRGSFLDPFSGKIATSESFYQIEPETEIQQGKSEIAYLNCNDFIRRENVSASDIGFGEGDFSAWDLSSGHLLIKSHLYESESDGANIRKNYTCRIDYKGGDYREDENWEVAGVEISDG